MFVDPSGHISINAIKIIAGVAQITLGGIACWTGVGCAAGLFAIANGVDDIYSGVRGLQKGDSNATGFIEDFGNVVGEGVGLGPGVGGLSLKMATALVGATAGAGIGGTASFAIPGVGSGGSFALVLFETSVTTGSVASTAAGTVSMAGPWMNQYSGGGHRQKTRGANRNDRKMVDDAARKAGVTDRRGFRDFLHQAKKAQKRGPSDNFSWKEPLELALEFKASGGG